MHHVTPRNGSHWMWKPSVKLYSKKFLLSFLLFSTSVICSVCELLTLNVDLIQ